VRKGHVRLYTRLIICLGVIFIGRTSGHAAGSKRDHKQIEEATRLQIFLDNSNFGPGKIDGKDGEFTRKAITLFKRSQGLTNSVAHNGIMGSWDLRRAMPRDGVRSWAAELFEKALPAVKGFTVATRMGVRHYRLASIFAHWAAIAWPSVFFARKTASPPIVNQRTRFVFHVGIPEKCDSRASS
jgi:peptidoglycan hydrolase-like protein with peptidoglycan-binding domain